MKELYYNQIRAEFACPMCGGRGCTIQFCDSFGCKVQPMPSAAATAKELEHLDLHCSVCNWTKAAPTFEVTQKLTKVA